MTNSEKLISSFRGELFYKELGYANFVLNKLLGGNDGNGSETF